MFDTNIKDMRSIIAITEEGSLSKAAEKLFTTQPNLSRIVQKTEEGIGAPLFNKEKTPWSLTYLGQLYIKTAKDILILNDRFTTQAQKIIRGESGLLRIATMVYEEKYLLPKLLTAFKRKHPTTNVETVVKTSTEIYDTLYKNLVDFAILINTHNKDFEYIPIKKYDILLALPLNHPLAAKYRYPKNDKSFPEIDLKLMAKEHFVMMKHAHLFREITTKICHKYGFDPIVSVDVFTADSALAYVETGCGSTFVFSELAIINKDKAAYFKIKNENLQQEIAFGYLKHKKPTILEKEFFTTIKTVNI